MSNADRGNFKKQFLCIGSSVRKVFKLLIYTQTSNMWYIFAEQYRMYHPNCELNQNQKQTGCFQLTEEVVIFCEINKSFLTMVTTTRKL